MSDVNDLLDEEFAATYRLASADVDRDFELGRLEMEVIKAAKGWREMLYMQAGTTRSRKALVEAVDALLKFESTHGEGE